MPAALPPSPDAYALFLRARAAMTDVAYPDRLAYTIVVSGNDGGPPRVNHYRAGSDPDTGAIRVFPISAEELAAPPPHPHDFQFALYVQGIRIPIGRGTPSPDLIGVPLLTPAYAFGLAYRRRAEPSAEGSGKLSTIAIVSTAREYAATLLGTESVDGVDTYHLGLRPLRAPKENRLRELWIGTSDYLPRKLVVAGNFTLAPMVDVPWTVTFEIAGGEPLISTERAGAALQLAHRRTVHDAEIAFENVRERDGVLAGEPLVEPEVTGSTLVEPPAP